jgi:GAF domain
MRLALEATIAARAVQTRQPVRMDDYSDAEDMAAQYAHSLGIRAAVGTPIVVEGRLWGLQQLRAPSTPFRLELAGTLGVVDVSGNNSALRCWSTCPAEAGGPHSSQPVVKMAAGRADIRPPECAALPMDGSPCCITRRRGPLRRRPRQREAAIAKLILHGRWRQATKALGSHGGYSAPEERR